MNLRAYLELGLIAAMAVLGFTACHQYNERLRAEGAYELLKASADSAAVLAAADKKATIERDSARAVVDRREAVVRAEATRRADRATARIPAAADNVVAAAAPPDTAAVRARLAVLQADYEDRDRARLDRIRSDSVVIAELRALDVTRLTAIASLEGTVRALQAVTEAGVETRPGWIERAARKLLVAGAFVGWVLLGRQLAG